MQEGQELHASPELKELVREASLALARLDRAARGAGAVMRSSQSGSGARRS